jgi:hypothetical protein
MTPFGRLVFDLPEQTTALGLKDGKSRINVDDDVKVERIVIEADSKDLLGTP